MSIQYLVVGAGGHATVVADALIAAGRSVAAFVGKGEARRELLGLPIIDETRDLPDFDRNLFQLVLGIGGTAGAADGERRADLTRRLAAQGWAMADVIHPSAIVSPSAQLGRGVQLMARCVVQPNAAIGDGTIINTAAVVEHDTVVETFCHVSIGAILCGGVTVGARSHIGAGATVREAVAVGRDVTIGMGAVVVGPCTDGLVYLGNPAREARRTS